MPDRPDHLIERAAALLRASQVARVPDRAAGSGFGGEPVLTLKDAATAFRPSVPIPSQIPVRPNPSIPSPKLVTPPPLPLKLPPTLGADSAKPPLPGVQSPAIHMLDGTPVVGLDVLERAGLVVARTKRTRVSEEYRIVIGRVLRALHEEPAGGGLHNLLLVTSARPGEGKSFTALNLAASIAQNTTESVILVDVDPKLKPVSDLLGLGDRLGFQDMMASPSLRPEDLVLSTAVPNLSILPVGTRLNDSAKPEDGSNAQLSTPAIVRLANHYPKSLLMLDAPPCLSTSDPHTIAPYVGQVIMVVEAERTQRGEVEAALDLVRACPNITMLLNKVRLTTSHTFGAYDYFGSYA